MTNHRWELFTTYEGFKKYSGPAKPVLILLYINIFVMLIGWIATIVCGEGKSIQDLPFFKELFGADDEINIEEGLEPYVESLSE